MTVQLYSVPVSCKACGANPATIHVEEPVSDESPASCKNCGAGFGVWGELKGKVAAVEQERINILVKDTMGKIGFGKKF